MNAILDNVHAADNFIQFLVVYPKTQYITTHDKAQCQRQVTDNSTIDIEPLEMILQMNHHFSFHSIMQTIFFNYNNFIFLFSSYETTLLKMIIFRRQRVDWFNSF